ncbi:TrkH family potassium uptake protein [Paraclostridium ghonii]|uniref:Trk system potassium uptake protein TrkH n=1 Tax=Paraclostridium ghonii TaxID=29358 RepID=A0ABU0MYD7_9FIRM|nr:potassium transporter TrkG [Paeniclostridium ghonii]MDQ0555866.1 trk system potassium uptake protein TrkH [Paeniclostridium ghonii]
MQLTAKKNTDIKTILYYIGIFTVIIGGILLLPLITLIFYKNEIALSKYFIIPSLLAIFLGILLIKFNKEHENTKLSVGQDAIIVVLVWILATLFSAMPFILSNQLNFTQAYFEAVSGWTTAGLSVVDVSTAPKMFLMHRSIMQFFGGVGIVLVVLSALSSTFGMRLYNSEGHSDNLLPNLLKSSRLILSIYLGYIIGGIIIYYICGMPLFDAINHSISALSTGGFSVKVDSIGYYNNIYIELVTIILMILGTTNFAAHVLLINGNLKRFFKVSEVKFMFIVIAISIPLISFFSLNKLYGDMSTGIRVAAFQVVSALSTAGYSTVDLGNWSPFAILVLIILMIIGGGAGSTAGGVKLYRVNMMIRSIIWNLRKQFMSEHTIKEDYIYKPQGKVYIQEDDIRNVYNFMFLYMIVYLIGVSIMLIYGYDLQDSMFEFASALGTVGLSVGVTSPDAPTVVLWTETIGMFLGRLEIWIVFIALIKMSKIKGKNKKLKVGKNN